MIRLSLRIRRLASVGVGLVTLHGCATHRVDVPSTAGESQITVRPGRAGLVVAARQVTRDVAIADMAAEIARRTGFGLVVASGLAMDEDGRRPAAQQGPSAMADRGDEIYEQRIREAAQGALRFYAEIDGRDGLPCAGQIEIATIGVDRELALRLRALAELIRDAHLRGHQEVPRLDVLIEPVDAVTSRAWGASRDGILRLSERSLHVELPPCRRRDWREAYTAILADFLAEAVTLAGR